jgi:hypothetical protein
LALDLTTPTPTEVAEKLCSFLGVEEAAHTQASIPAKGGFPRDKPMRLRGCFALPNAVIESLSNLLITIMKSDHPATHPDHDHKHGPGCGHTAIEHDGHVDYLHDGHLHHPTGNAAQVEEHILEVMPTIPQTARTAATTTVTRQSTSTGRAAATKRCPTASIWTF